MAWRTMRQTTPRPGLQGGTEDAAWSAIRPGRDVAQLKRSAQRPEERANVLDQRLGLLHGGEMPAALELGEALEVVGPGHPLAWRARDLVRQAREAGRRVDVAGREYRRGLVA